MSKKLFSSIIILLVGVLFVAISIFFTQTELQVDISKSDSLSGKVEFAYGRIITKANRYWASTYDYYYIKLYNSDQLFAVDRKNDGFSDLTELVRPGDSIKFYYSASHEIPNTNIFQIEKKGQIIDSYEDYKKRNANSIGLTLFAGVILIVYSFMVYFNLSPVKILSWLVEGNKTSS